NLFKRGGIGVNARHATQHSTQLCKGRWIASTAVRLDTVSSRCSKTGDIPIAASDRNHGYVHGSTCHHRFQRSEDLFESQSSLCAEQAQNIGMPFAHGNLLYALMKS